MSEKLKGKNAIVTGAAGGIGREVCLSLVAEGANVVVNDIGATRDGSGAEAGPVDKVVAEIRQMGGNAVSNFESVTDFDGAGRLVKACVDTFGRLDILINCHGNLRDRMIWNMTEEEWDSVMYVHLKGTFNTCQHACVVMREQKFGRIVNVTSDAWRGTVGHANYGAVKGGVVSFTKSIAREMGRFNVTANCFAPIAATRMTLDEEVKQGILKRVATGVMTQTQADALLSMPGPEYIPPIIVYLSTDEARNVTGQVFHAEGGRIGIYSEPVEIRSICKSEGKFTTEELIDLVPKVLLLGYINPAPPPEQK